MKFRRHLGSTGVPTTQFFETTAFDFLKAPCSHNDEEIVRVPAPAAGARRNSGDRGCRRPGVHSDYIYGALSPQEDEPACATSVRRAAIPSPLRAAVEDPRCVRILRAVPTGNVCMCTCTQALFAASFKAMERSFGFSPAKLGVLQMWQSLSFSVSLPVWGVFLPALGAFMYACVCVDACVRGCVRAYPCAGLTTNYGVYACAGVRKRGWT